MAVVSNGDKGGGSRVLSRSSTKPIFVALGTATVLTLSPVALPAPALAADLGPAAGDDPSADPPDSPPASDPPPDISPPEIPQADIPQADISQAVLSPPDISQADIPQADLPPLDRPAPPDSPPTYRPSPVLSLRLTLSAGAAMPGGSVTATARVSAQRAVAHRAVLRFSASSASVSGPVSLGDLSGERSVSGVVRIPAGHASGAVTVTASLSADRAGTRIATGKINVTATVDEAAKGAEIGGAEPPSLSLPVPGLPGTAAAMGGPAQVRLPMIAQQQQPPVASAEPPSVRPVSLRTKASRPGLDPASYRLFWTQAAWLATLLVAVSLLLTRLRLNRRRLPAAARGSRRRTPGGRPSGRR